MGNLLERSVLALHDVRTSEQPSDKALKPSRHGKAGDKWAWQWLLRLGILAGWFWGAALACHLYVEPVSRQSANAAYVLWMMAFNVQTLCAFVLGALLFPSAFGRTAKLLDVCNRRLLVVFLVANATTRIVNVCRCDGADRRPAWRRYLSTWRRRAHAVSSTSPRSLGGR